MLNQVQIDMLLTYASKTSQYPSRKVLATYLERS